MALKTKLRRFFINEDFSGAMNIFLYFEILLKVPVLARLHQLSHFNEFLVKLWQNITLQNVFVTNDRDTKLDPHDHLHYTGMMHQTSASYVILTYYFCFCDGLIKLFHAWYYTSNKWTFVILARYLCKFTLITKANKNYSLLIFHLLKVLCL